VIVQHEQGSAREAHARVRAGPTAVRGLTVQHAHLFTVRLGHSSDHVVDAAGVAAVVDDDAFPLGEGLRRDAAERAVEELRTILRAHDDRDARLHGGHVLSVPFRCRSSPRPSTPPDPECSGHQTPPAARPSPRSLPDRARGTASTPSPPRPPPHPQAPRPASPHTPTAGAPGERYPSPPDQTTPPPRPAPSTGPRHPTRASHEYHPSRA